MARASSSSSARGGRRAPEFGRDDVQMAKDVPQRTTRISVDGYPMKMGAGTAYHFKRIPGAEQYADNVPIEAYSSNPLAFRDAIVCCIPERVLTHAAKSWGDLAIREGVEANLGVYRMLSFFLHAVYQKGLQCGGIRTYIEVVLRKEGTQPICYGEMANTKPEDLPIRISSEMRSTDFQRSNVAGYRIWAILGAEFGPETLMRSALFSIQLSVNMIDKEVYELKQRFLIEPDPQVRETMLRTFALEKAIEVVTIRNKKTRKPAPRKPKSYVDDDASDGGFVGYDSDGDESSVASANGTAKPTAPEVLKELEKILAKIYTQIRDEPAGQVTREYSTLAIKGRVSHHCAIATLPRYISDVIGPAHHLAGIYSTERIDSACVAVSGPWKEALSLPDIEGSLSVRDTFSFEMSNLILDPPLAPLRDEERPCPVQMQSRAYGLDDDEFHPPMPYCVWQVHPSGLSPEVFLNELMLWQGNTFADDVAYMELEVAAEESRRRAEMQRSSAVHRRAEESAEQSKLREMSTMAGPVAMKDRGEPIRALQNSTRQSSLAFMNRMRGVGGAGPPMTPPASPLNRGVAYDPMDEDSASGLDGGYGAAIRDPVAEMDRAFHDRNINHLYVSDVEMYARTNDRMRVEVERVQNGLKPVAEKYQALWKRAVQCVERMVAPEGIPVDDFEAHKYSILCDMQRKISPELFDEIMNTMASGKNISDSHRSAYALLVKTGLVEHVLNKSAVPNMSTCSAMLIGDMLNVTAGTNMQSGLIHYHTLSQVISLQAASLEQRPGTLHTGIIGPAQAGKSMMATAAQQAALRGAISAYDHQSNLAGHSTTFDGGHVAYHDEANAIMADQSVMAQMKNPDERARAKLKMTTGLMNTRRLEMNKEGHGSTTVQIEKEHVAPEFFLANEFKVDVSSDMAPLTRRDVFVMVPEVDTPVTIADRVVDPNPEARRARWNDMCQLSHQAQSVNMFMTLAARCGLIRSVNIDLLRIMQAKAMIAADVYVPSFLNNIRSIQRQLDYASLCVFLTAFYSMFRSEASPLLQMTDDLSEVHSVKPAYLAQIAQLMGPYLCANHEHGLWMITRMVTVEYPFEYYRVLRIIAGLEGRFRRCIMKAVYRAHRVPLVDDEVAELMKERKDVEVPLYIREMEANELDIDHQTAARFDIGLGVGRMSETSMPRFHNVRRYPINRSTGTGHVVNPLASGPNIDNSRLNSRGRCDPNWIDIGASKTMTIQTVLGYLKSFVQVNEKTLSTIFDFTNVRTVRHPVFAEADYAGNECPASALRFARDTSDPSGRKILYREDPITKVIDGRFVLLTYAMMLPPQMLLFVLLCSSENVFTREREVALPLEIAKSPGLLYRHSVKRRPGKLSFSVIASNAGVTRQRMEVQHGPSKFIDSISRSHRIFDQDPEIEVFRDHMRASYLAPNYHEFVEMLSLDPQTCHLIKENGLHVPENTLPTATQYAYVFDKWVNTHPARPGRTEERAEWLYRDAPMFASSRALLDVHYPQTEILETRIQSTVMRLERSHSIFPLKRRVAGATAAEKKMLDELSACKQFVLCLQWRFPSAWVEKCHLLANVPERRSLIEETFSNLSIALPRIPDTDPQYTMPKHRQRALVPAGPIAPPAQVVLYTAQNFTSGSAATMVTMESHHLRFLEQYYSHRTHLRKLALAMTHLWITRPGAIDGDTTAPEFVALDVVRAQEFVLSGQCNALLPVYETNLRDARARDVSATPGRFSSASLLTPEDRQLLQTYRLARDWTRGMRAVILVDLKRACELSIQFTTMQSARAAEITSSIERARDQADHLEKSSTGGSGTKRRAEPGIETEPEEVESAAARAARMEEGKKALNDRVAQLNAAKR